MPTMSCPSSRARRVPPTWLLLVPGLAAVLFVISCSVNPATGKRELSLVSEAQERALGIEADPQIINQFGLYDDEDLQQYIQELGDRLAAFSERPDLDWKFRVLDDPLVNAFALPGGFIYVTRGILSYFNSEAELAGVLGHEIGHVTARHSASQMSKQMLAQIGLVAGAVAAPEEAQQWGGLAQSLTGLLFLKYSRDDERQADSLAVRYTLRTGHDPSALIKTFETFQRLAAQREGGPPVWASTHPDPGGRARLLQERIATAQATGEFDGDETDLIRERDSYLRRLDGMIYGQNPREGFFKEARFYHPDLRFVLDFPDGWPTQNARSQVAAISPEQDAMVLLTLAEKSTTEEELRAFFQAEQVVDRGRFDGRFEVSGSVGRRFDVIDAERNTVIGGAVVVIPYEGRLYRVLGYAKSDRLSRRAAALSSTLTSFEPLRDQRYLNVQPLRLRIEPVRRDASIEEVIRPGAVTEDELLAINGFSRGDTVKRGDLVKVVEGELP